MDNIKKAVEKMATVQDEVNKDCYSVLDYICDFNFNSPIYIKIEIMVSLQNLKYKSVLRSKLC